MLKFEIPNAPDGAKITWKVTKNDQSTAAGRFYQGGEWRDYQRPRNNPPEATEAYWRSEVDDDAQDVYYVSAMVKVGTQPSKMAGPKPIRTRVINYDSAIAMAYHSDVDMLQRAMIQVFYIAKGKLKEFAIGCYAAGSDTYYRLTTTNNYFSPIAEEVDNFQQFTLNWNGKQGRPLHSKNAVVGFISGLWAEYNLIAAAGTFQAITATSPNYNSWITAAISSAPLTVPADFTTQTGKTSNDLLKAQVRKEGENRHSYALSAPLAYNNVTIGWNRARGPGTDFHAFTDGGLGFTKVQPYNRDAFNLYVAQSNLTRGAQFLNGRISNAYTTQGAVVQVWFGLYAYNIGSNPPVGSTPSQLRASTGNQKKGAQYADDIFSFMGLPPPS